MRILAVMLIIVAAVLIALPVSSSAQSPVEPTPKSDTPAYSKTLILSSFIYDSRSPRKAGKWFDARVILPRKDTGREREELREQWEEFLGVDVFYPYFKAKKVEQYVQSKTAVEFFKFKGKAEFETGSSSFKYIFKKKF